MYRRKRNGSAVGRSLALAIVAVAAVSLLTLPAAGQEKRGKDVGKRLARTIEQETASSALGPTLYSNFNGITWASGANAVPYPSNITVGGWCPGPINDVNVTFFFFGSDFPDDTDILLVGPGGQRAMVMSDAGGSTDVEDIDITLDDEAASAVPDAAALSDGTFRPANYEPGETMPAPAPGLPYASTLSTFDGTNANGVWSLYITDEVNFVSPGDIEIGWQLEINVTTSPTGSQVCIPHAGLGEPYPSLQTVSGRTNPVQDVNVTLGGLSHTFTDDLDILLQGPGGQSAMLMSDAGDGNTVTNVNLTFDDEAAASLPDSAQIVSGTFKPSNFESLENLPAPAPSTGGTSLAVFDGTNPNGPWRLFVRDDIGSDQGILSSWSLQITTPQATVTVKGGKVKEGKKRTFTIRRTENIGQSETVSFATKSGTAKQGKDFKKKSGTLTFAPGEASKKVKVKTKDDGLAERTEKFFLRATAGGVTSQGAARIKDND